MKLAVRGLGVVLLLVVLGAAVLWFAGGGGFGASVHAGEPTAAPLPAATVVARQERQAEAAAALDVSRPKQILFGDLHVHSSFSIDAFQLTLSGAGGRGTHPVADACDFARFCADLDFWSINDHAASLTARRWAETVASVRQCDAIASAGAEPDQVAFLGWEWTQMGSTPENHYGHRNVVLRDLGDDAIPTRPIAAAPPPGVPSAFDAGRGGRLGLGIGAFLLPDGQDLVAQIAELNAMPRCPLGVPVRELPLDCSEAVETPGELFAKLDDWGHAATVIPHGTVWGMYTPPGSSWAKQLDPVLHDPARQRLVEVYSGHGNAEEYRPWVAAEILPDGSRRCPAPGPGYEPACWRAGEIIRARCLAAQAGTLEATDCEERAAEARQNFVDADRNGGVWTVPGIAPGDLRDAGQCRDCFQPAFNYRPRGSVQYMLALGRPEQAPGARRFRFGFIASSDNHTARPGTGYKEHARREITDARMAEVGRSDLVRSYGREPLPRSERLLPEAGVPSVALLEAERSGSFYLSGGLAAVHARGRERGAIWEALERRETYGTSGPRILLWFDLLDPNAPGGAWPMGSELAIAGAPTFRVRAAGSFEQRPGCPASTGAALPEERIAALCQGECYHPSDRRRPIVRIEVVRIRNQTTPGEDVKPLIEDPWKRFACSGDPAGCQVVFSDPDFAAGGRATSYYVRAVEAASPVVAADPLGCSAGDAGPCSRIDPCFERPDDDDCLAPSEQRAWSSPIFLDPAAPAPG